MKGGLPKISVGSLEKIRDIIKAKTMEEEKARIAMQHNSLSAECSSTKSESGCCMGGYHS
jgi:hypothetical protein